MIYDYTTSLIANALSPIRYRIAKFQAMLICLLKPLQWSRDNFFNEYVNGSTAAAYNNSHTYAIGDRMKYIDNAIYEAQISTIGNIPSLANQPSIWIKITNDFRGANARSKYNSQKLVLEWVLNEWFGTTFRQPDHDGSSTAPTNSDIYITQIKPYNPYFVFGNDINGSPFINLDQFTNKFIDSDTSPVATTFRIIHVPDSGGSPRPGWYTALGGATTGQQKIRNIVDRYNLAGTYYLINTY